MNVGHKYTDFFGNFFEYSIKGIPKKQKKIVIQKGKDTGPPFYGIWYIYEVTPDLVTTIGWSRYSWKAITKARQYIREMR